MQHKFVNKLRLKQPLDRMSLAWVKQPVKLEESMLKGQFSHLVEDKHHSLAILHLNNLQLRHQLPR